MARDERVEELWVELVGLYQMERALPEGAYEGEGERTPSQIAAQGARERVLADIRALVPSSLRHFLRKAEDSTP